jgi:hypothetical protein
MPASRPRQTPAMKRRQRIILLGFLIFCGLIATSVGFLPNRDLADYQRLVNGTGVKVAATSAGGVGSTVSGSRRSGDNVQYCTSWRYELDGNERFFTDRNDCYPNRQDAPTGASGELIYDPNDRGTMFVAGQRTLDNLERTGATTRWIGIGGGVATLAGLICLYLVVRRKPTENV